MGVAGAEEVAGGMGWVPGVVGEVEPHPPGLDLWTEGVMEAGEEAGRWREGGGSRRRRGVGGGGRQGSRLP